MGCVNGKCLSQQSSSSPNESRNDKENAGIGVENRELNAANIATENVCEVVRVPAYGYELKYAYLSHRGYYPEAPDKANQDSFCIHTRFKNNPNDHFFGVFDGHGQYGAQCSEFVKKKLCEHLVKDPLFSRDVVQAYHSAFRSTNADLHNSNSIDDSMSGTTAITVLVRGKTLFVANVGDSRALIAEKRGNGIVAVDLSSDQTPFRADECDRVKLCGARVLSLDQLEGLKDPNIQYWGTEENDDGGDPPRLWVPNGNYPGTAFTRSVGDDTAESIGVIAVPEVTVLELTADHPFFVVASDGVFEFLSSQAVVDMENESGCFYIVGKGEFEALVSQDECLSALYIIQQGELKLTYNSELELESSVWKAFFDNIEWEGFIEFEREALEAERDMFWRTGTYWQAYRFIDCSCN